MYKIEKGIPVPLLIRTDSTLYPFGLMNPGESFFIPFEEIENLPDKKEKTLIIRRRIMYAFNQYKKRHKLTKKDFKVSLRGTDDGVRCWRVK